MGCAPVQVVADEGRRLQEGLNGLLGETGERQRDLSREVINPTVSHPRLIGQSLIGQSLIG